MLLVACSERIPHVGVHVVGESARKALVIARFSKICGEIRQQTDLARPQLTEHAAYSIADAVVRYEDLHPVELVETRRELVDARQPELGSRVLGQSRSDHHSRLA